MNADAVAAAFVWACTLDVDARKPGNVSRASPGHGMDADVFVASAVAAAAPLCAPSRPVGERIEAAVHATHAAAGCNTNLGIVLLCAPLAAAVEHWRSGDGAAGLQSVLAEVLLHLDLEDARAAYRAIALARPGGLGSLDAHDVAQPASIALGAAMALAADRDRIAWQYGHAHADLFETGLPVFETALVADPSPSAQQAMQRVYLEFLATLPDSHIVRKHGISSAHSVMNEARVWVARARRGDALDADPGFAEWDASLKGRGLNPGTSADLCVGTAFVAALCGRRSQGAAGLASSA